MTSKQIPKRLYTCSGCSRHYTRKSSWERHELTCKIISKSERERKLNIEEQVKTPNILELYSIIQELTIKQHKLEIELNECKSFIKKTKKRLNIIDWLNDNCKSIDYLNFVKNITINRNQLNYIFKYDFIDGMMFIMQELLPLEDNIPIRCFDQKQGVFFIKRNDNWITMTAIEFENLLDVISKLIIQEFGDWQIENQDKILSDNDNDDYEENILKVLGTKRPKSTTYMRIKNKLYSYLKFNLKRIVQFDFN